MPKPPTNSPAIAGSSPVPCSASLGPIRRKVNSRRNSECGSCNLELLDWTNWWTDGSGDTFYLHVRRFDIEEGETYHRVYCRGHYRPRLRIIDGELFWLIPRQNDNNPATGSI